MFPRLASPLYALAAVGASVALVACGGSSSSGSSSGTGTSTASSGSSGSGATSDATLQKFQQCLKDNGVTLPNRGNGQAGPGAGNGQGGPGGGNGYGPPQGGAGGGANGGKFGKAMQACAKYRPQGAGGGPNGANGNGQRPGGDIKAFTPYLNCLKDQGLDVKVSDGFNALRGLKQSDPKVQAAFKACQSKLPQRPNGGAQQGTSTNGTT